MPYFEFFSTDDAMDYIAEHGVTPDEFEEVVCNPEARTTSESSGRPLAMGQTTSGKYLICVYEMLDDIMVYPITAYEPD